MSCQGPPVSLVGETTHLCLRCLNSSLAKSLVVRQCCWIIGCCVQRVLQGGQRAWRCRLVGALSVGVTNVPWSVSDMMEHANRHHMQATAKFSKLLDGAAKFSKFLEGTRTMRLLWQNVQTADCKIIACHHGSFFNLPSHTHTHLPAIIILSLFIDAGVKILARCIPQARGWCGCLVCSANVLHGFFGLKLVPTETRCGCNKCGFVQPQAFHMHITGCQNVDCLGVKATH